MVNFIHIVCDYMNVNEFSFYFLLPKIVIIALLHAYAIK